MTTFPRAGVVGKRRHAGRHPWFAALTLGLSLVLAASGPVLAATPDASPGPVEPTEVDLPINPTAIVQVSVEGLLRSGEPFTADGFGVVVDPTGLILAPANLVAPDAPGVAVRYGDWNLPASVTAITIRSAPAQGQPATASFSGRVLAADGYLDVAVVGLDPAPGVSFASVGLSTATRAVGEDVVVVDAGPLVVGGGIQPRSFAATITEQGPHYRIATDPSWLGTDYVPGDMPNAGSLLITDQSGLLVALPTLNPTYAAPTEAWGWLPTVIQPILDAARAGTDYTTPYVVPGTGDENWLARGWSTAENPCQGDEASAVDDYPAGATRIATSFEVTGMTPGEDIVNVWWDPVERLLDYVDEYSWDEEGPDGCTWSALAANEGALANREYALSVFVGGTLRQVTFVRTEVKAEAPADAVNATGRVIDADTGIPLEFAFVTVLQPGVDIRAWFENPDDTQVAATAITDADGTFTTQPGVAPGEYPFIVQSFGYQPIGGNLDLRSGGFLPDIALAPLE